MAAANNPLESLNFGDAPGGELTFDQLFPTDQGAQPTTAESGTPSEPVQPEPQVTAPVPPPVEEFFLRAGDSVYKSKEEVERGIQTKDSLIQELRLKEIARTGIDPITNKPVNLGPQQTQPAIPDYTQDQSRYFQDLVQAVDKNDPKAYYDAQAKLVYDLLAPIAPTITQMARERAVQTASTGEQGIKDLGQFLDGPAYKETLSKIPALQGAIEAAEGDMRMYNQLPGLYQLAYWTSQGQRLPDLLKAAQTQPQSNQAPQTRPLTQPQTPVPPTVQSNFDISTKEGRKAIQDRMEQHGIQNLRW
jgi:hypothetical protein